MTEDPQRAAEAPAEATSESPSIPPEEGGDDREKTRRRPRAKMTLRIPDDEVARPSDGGVARGSVPDADAPQETEDEEKPGSIIPTPIINVGTPSSPAPPPDEIPKPPAAPVIPLAPKSDPDESWTPYQPSVAEAPPTTTRAAVGSDPDSIDVSIEEEAAGAAAAAAPPPPIAELSTSDMVPDSADIIPESIPTEPLELDEEETHATLSSRPPPPVVPAPAVISIALPPPAGLPAIAAVEAAPAPAPASIADPDVVTSIPQRVRSEPPPPPTHAPSSPPPRTPSGMPAAARPTLPEPRVSRPPASALIDEAEAANIQEIEPDRMSEPPPEPVLTKPRPGVDEGELAADDVVSVESLPAAAMPNLQARPSSPPTAPKSPPLPARAPLLIVPPTIGGPPSPLAPPPIGESAPKRKGRLWWEELFGDDFIRTMAKITDEQIAAEVDFIEDSLGVAKGGTMLDLACGTGRHAIELARRGYQIVGFDLSLAMLARAADEAQDRDQKINFVQGDMREMTFENTFDGIYSWNTSFGFFEEDRNAAVIGKVHKALRAGGQFLLDVVNRDFIVNQAPSLVWFEGDGCICMDEMQMDWITSRMRVKRTMMLDDGRSKEIEYSIRVYSLHELGKLMHDQGFRIAEVSGRTATPGVFFGATSPRTLILAEKKS